LIEQPSLGLESVPMPKKRMLPLLALATLVGLGAVACRGFFVNPTLTSISVAPQNASVAIGATLQFTATGVNNDGTTGSLHNLTWSTSASTIATVSTTGVAKGVSAGTATITATEGTISGSSTLTVGSTSFAISPTNATESLSTGSVQFTATSNGQIVTTSTTWSSSNTNVAVFSTITPGLATLQGTGTTTITATFTPTSGSQQTATTTLTVQ
jgi:uncharacterized protein YjdB